MEAIEVKEEVISSDEDEGKSQSEEFLEPNEVQPAESVVVKEEYNWLQEVEEALDREELDMQHEIKPEVVDIDENQVGADSEFVDIERGNGDEDSADSTEFTNMEYQQLAVLMEESEEEDETTEDKEEEDEEEEQEEAEEDWDAYARHVAQRLRELTEPVRIVAEKLITDVLIQGTLGQITDGSPAPTLTPRDWELFKNWCNKRQTKPKKT